MVTPGEHLAAALAFLLCLSTRVGWSSATAEHYPGSDYTRLQDLLAHYDVLLPEDVETSSAASAWQTRSRRHTAGEQQQQPDRDALLQVQFATLGRNFTLYLTYDRDIYASGFESLSVDSHGVKKQIKLSDKNLYKGHISGDLASSVTAYWERQALVAKIETAEETYYIEPAERWLSGISANTRAFASAMLAYRQSDVRFIANNDLVNRNKSFCGTRNTAHKKRGLDNNQPSQGSRKKREVLDTNSCSLLLIADYLFFKDVANGSETAAILFMVNLANNVDRIYRRTVWSNGWTGMGFAIRKVLVHTNWSINANHYNAKRKWTIDELLQALGDYSIHEEPFHEFCLVHLFSGYRAFSGVLGYAVIGNPRIETGACASHLTPLQDGETYQNIGFTTQFARNNRRLFESEAETVLAHELGHNWGSDHDPNTTECFPDPDDTYIMHGVSNSHPKQNAKLFSPCSVRQITAVIEKKAGSCFEVVRDVTRGNYRIDSGEECDAGVSGDHCCGADFKLKSIDSCSDANHMCCKNCSMANAADSICHFESVMDCRAESRCTNADVNCPVTFRQTGSKCFPDSSGRCRMQSLGDGQTVVCATLCETLGLKSCRCREAPNMCKLCCQLPGQQCSILHRSDYDNRVLTCTNNGSRHCRQDEDFSFEPYEWLSDVITLPTDSSCLIGFCDSEGICNKQPQDMLFSLAQFLSTLTPSKAVRFMKDNIVGTIIVFSLALWIPVSYYIQKMDRKADEKAQKSRLGSLCISDLTSPYLIRRNIPNSNQMLRIGSL